MFELFADFIPCLKSLNGKCWLLAIMYGSVVVAVFVLAIGNNCGSRTARTTTPVVRRAVRENRRSEPLAAREISAPTSAGPDA